MAVAVEHGRTAVAAGDIVVAQEAEVHLLGLLVGILAELALLEQFHYVGLQFVVLYLLLLCSLVQKALAVGEVVVVRTVGGVVLDEAVGQAHGHVGVGIVCLVHLHVHEGLCEQALVVVDDRQGASDGSQKTVVCVDDVIGILHGDVRLAQGAVGYYLCNAGGVQQAGLGKDILGIGLGVAAIEAVYQLVEVGQELALGPCAVVLEEHTHGFLVHAGFVVLVESLQVVHAQGSILGGGIKGQT